MQITINLITCDFKLIKLNILIVHSLITLIVYNFRSLLSNPNLPKSANICEDLIYLIRDFN